MTRGRMVHKRQRRLYLLLVGRVQRGLWSLLQVPEKAGGRGGAKPCHLPSPLENLPVAFNSSCAPSADTAALSQHHPDRVKPDKAGQRSGVAAQVSPALCSSAWAPSPQTRLQTILPISLSERFLSFMVQAGHT